jgi:hypothetical protein
MKAWVTGWTNKAMKLHLVANIRKAIITQHTDLGGEPMSPIMEAIYWCLIFNIERFVSVREQKQEWNGFKSIVPNPDEKPTRKMIGNEKPLSYLMVKYYWKALKLDRVLDQEIKDHYLFEIDADSEEELIARFDQILQMIEGHVWDLILARKKADDLKP